MNFKISERIPIFTVIATCFMVSTNFMDPINLPKLMVLVIGTFFVVCSWFFQKSFHERFHERMPILIVITFLLGLSIAALASNQNVMRTLIGTNGRNNGYISYLCLLIIFFEGINIGRRNQSDRFIRTLAMLGFFQGVYGFMQMNRADIFHFVYGGNPIILTLGNEDFSSLLLTLTALASIYSMIETRKDVWKFFYFFSCIFQIWIIININTAQSKLSLTAGLLVFIITFYLTKSKLNSKERLLVFIPLVLVTLSAVLGFLGRGPLSTINSNLRNFQSRVYHWQEAWSMFKTRPITGIGLDSYGLYQPYYRVITADGTPDTYSNNAHNVVLQLLSTGGLVLTLAFLVLITFVLYRHIVTFFSQNLQRNHFAFNSSFLVVFIAHLIVGIDNLGLIVFFWFISGLIVGTSYSRVSTIKSKAKRREEDAAIKTNHLPNIFKIVLTTLMIFSTVVTSREVLAHLSISRILVSNGQIKINANDTQRIFNAAVKSQDPDLRLISIRTLYTLGSLKEGFALASDSLRRFPRDLPTLDAVAIYYEQTKNYQKAVEVRKEMVRLDPLSDVLKQKLADDLKFV